MNFKKNPKSDVRNKSLLFFQIGLIVMLFASWQAMEYKSIANEANMAAETLLPLEDVIEIPITEIKKETLPPVKKTIVEINILPDDAVLKEDDFFAIEIDQDDKIIVDPGSIIEVPDDEPIEDIILNLVSEVPVFPGCENTSNNNERRKCMSKKISRFVQKKFDKNLASRLGLEGKQRITVLFKIDESGEVVDVIARAPHKKLAEEAEKVVNQLPVMKAGKHNGKPVRVLYTLPIVFQVVD